MSLSMVISIREEYARKIYSGNKLFEFRTRKPLQDVEYLVLYETTPTCAITGVAKVSDILEGTPAAIWEKTKEYAGISRKKYCDYYSGKNQAVAFCLSSVYEFEDAISLQDIRIKRAPQSFQYVDSELVEAIVPFSNAKKDAGCRL